MLNEHDLHPAISGPQSAPERHFSVFPDLPSSDAPSQDDRLDRLLAALDALACCEPCRRRWFEWILSGRFGKDAPTALAAVVLELAMQHGETISQQDQVSWMQKTTSPP